MPQSHGHHHGQRETDPSLHLGLAADGVLFKAKAVIDPAVDRRCWSRFLNSRLKFRLEVYKRDH
jgi:hypothetical protein